MEEDDLDHSLGFLVRRTHQAFSRAMERRLAKEDLSLLMYLFLRHLWENEGLTQKQISDNLDLRQSTTVSIMDSLAERGLIYRSRNKVDRRLVNIFLTEQGHKLKETLSNCARDVNTLADLDEAEKVQLWALLEKVKGALERDS